MRIDEIKTSNFTKMNLLELNNNLIESGFNKKQTDTLCKAFNISEDKLLTRKEAHTKLATKGDIQNLKGDIQNLKFEIEQKLNKFEKSILKSQLDFQTDMRQWTQKTQYFNYTVLITILIKLFYLN